MTNAPKVLATIVLLSCAGCANRTSEPPSVAATPSAPASTAGPTAAAAEPPAVRESDPLVGRLAPDFTATAQDGTAVNLAALRGKPVVVYFYPKDETPGCTKEACSFRDAWQPIALAGAVVVGISADTLDSHKSFAAHYKLPFLLVSDPDGAIGRAYGVPFEGHHQRQTILIGSDGKIRKVYRKVDVTIHAQQVLAELTHAT
jgi:thioredoxin-dependent peroxiredoxin